MKTIEEIHAWVTNFWDIANSKYTIPWNSHFKLLDRTWPDTDIEKAPRWVSVDLRDGNQSLENPMTVAQKIEHFLILVRMGFKEIEIGFPSASQEDYNFVRKLIEEELIPEDVTIQVLVPSKKELIEKTRLSLEWAKNIIVHLYNSTSSTQRNIVFWFSKQQTIDLALAWVWNIKEQFRDFSWNIIFQYSPESFTGTEIEFARDICAAVIEKWSAFRGKEVIINLPATVENTTPDRYADKIEWMVRELKYNRKDINQAIAIIISLHTHNDRGTGISATELWLKAGADRVEGTLFWNGERAGNVPLEVLALNMFTQGIPPNLDLSFIWDIAQKITQITGLPIPPRHPYLWEFVHTAFSGSHQDAIKKWFDAQKRGKKWDNPYLPIDPKDIGLSYTPIRINSQSGKWWASFVIEQAGYKIPKEMQRYIGEVIQKLTEQEKSEISAKTVVQEFKNKFINVEWALSEKGFHYEPWKWNKWIVEQLSDYVSEKYTLSFEVLDWHGDSKTEGTWAIAVNYFKIKIGNRIYFWIGEDSDIAQSSLRGLISALNIGYNTL